MSDDEKIYRLTILKLLIALDEDLVDWRSYPKLWEAVRFADQTLNLWAGDNLKEMAENLERELEV